MQLSFFGNLRRYFSFPLLKLLLAVVIFAIPERNFAQDFPEYDELMVEFHIPRLGTYELPIAIKDEQAYIAVSPLLDLLKLKNEKSEDGKMIAGFIIRPEEEFLLNSENAEVILKEEKLQLKPDDFIVTPSTFYLKADLFSEIFQLDTQFSFRSLSVKLDTELELPVIKERRLKEMRSNLNKVQGVVKPDTLIHRNYPFFKAGMLDWGAIITQQTEGIDDNRFTLGLGTMLAGGETNVRLNYSNNVPFTSRNQFYQWRYVNNENNIFKQITAGKIFTRATSSLFAPVVGVQFSNTPVANRRSFGTYTLSDYTEPRWTVELYVNNVLVDFTEADASGFYSFEVPLMYGNTAVALRFYGPYGQERQEERYINIPYNFIPKNELEYTLSAGVVEDEDNRRFSRFNLNYGLSNAVTFGGGVEYLSEVTSGEVMPFVNTSARLASNLLFSGEYMFGVKAQGLLSYRTPRGFQVDLNYINYDEDQTAINYNYLEERKITLSSPIRTSFFRAYSRLSLNQVILPTTEFTTAQFLLSGVLFGVSTNLTTYGLFNERAKDPTIYSTLSQTYRLPAQLLFSPQLQYEYSSREFTNLVLELERPVFKRGFFNLAYENNFRRNAHIFEIGLRYNFNFAQTSTTARLGNRNSSFVQSAQGSLMYDSNTGYVNASRRSSVGRGGISLIPFLDLNTNGKKDPMEPGVSGMQIRNKFGRLTYYEDETILRISELQPYVEMMLEIDPVSLDNIAWKVPNQKILVETVPNQFKTIYVPVEVLGEVAGMVYLKTPEGTSGQGRIIVNIFDDEGSKVAKILTEGDGYFSYLGLKPGNYTAEIDAEQLSKLGYQANPSSASFEIEVDEYGDIMDTLEFTLEKE